MIDYLLVWISVLLLLIWFVGCLLPIVPWPMIAFFWVLILHFTSEEPFSRKFLVMRFIIHIIAIVFDNFIPSLWTKLFKWTKRWVWWSTIWIIFAIIWLPFLWIVLWLFWVFWLLLWPFVWAYIWEMLHTKNPKQAMRSALGSFFWFLSWTFLKIILTGIMAFYVIRFLF